MDERSNFLAALAANPTDDTARLVFADWLQEHGEPDRAALVRAEYASRVPGGRAAQAEFRRLTRSTSWLTADEEAAVANILVSLAGAVTINERQQVLAALVANLTPLHPARQRLAYLAERVGEWAQVVRSADDAQEHLDEAITEEILTSNPPSPDKDRATWVEGALAALSRQVDTPHLGGMIDLARIIQS